MVAKQATIEVFAPDGCRNIKNPLLGYRFNPVYSDFGDGSKDENGVDDEKTVRLFLPRASASSDRCRRAVGVVAGDGPLPDDDGQVRQVAA